MKQVKTLLLIAIFSIGLTGIANAQKIGHINTDRLLSEMPETKSLQAELDKLSKTYKDDLEAKASKLQSKIQKYQAEGETQTQEVNEKRAAEVQQENAAIVQAEQAATQEIQKRYQTKLEPILTKAQNAIQTVANEKGIIYVFDSSAGKGLIIFEKGEDLYNAVKTKLGF